jgi:hypothetical protein
MPLAHSNGPRWIRSQNVSNEQRLRGIEPIRAFLARLFGRDAKGPAPVPAPSAAAPPAGEERR